MLRPCRKLRSDHVLFRRVLLRFLKCDGEGLRLLKEAVGLLGEEWRNLRGRGGVA